MFILIEQDLKIFGVFDGHGPYGHKVSSYVQTRMIQFIKNNKKLTAEILIEPDQFEKVKKTLIEIFLTIQGELESNYEIFLDENFPEEKDENDTITEQEENKSVSQNDSKSSHESDSRERKNLGEQSKSKRNIITLKRDARTRFTNLTEKFVENLVLNGDESGADDPPFQLEDISLSGTTATVVFQVGTRIIMAY